MCQHPQGGCTQHSLGAGVQNKQTVTIYYLQTLKKAWRTILQSILLNLHPHKVGMTGQPQLLPGAKQLQLISKATSGHARSSSLLSPPQTEQAQMSNTQITASLPKRQRCLTWEGSLGSPKGVGHAWRWQRPGSCGCKSCGQHRRMQMGPWMGPARSRVL